MEGGILYQAHRLSHWLPVYGRPEDGVVPFPYPPAHFATLALVGKLVGLDYWSARLISILAFVVLCAAQTWLVFQHVASRRVAIAAALVVVGAVAAGFPFVGAWYDVIRPDVFAMASVVASAALMSGDVRSTRRAVTAGLLLTLAIFSKQSCAFLALWLVAFAVVRDRRSGVLLGGVFFASSVLVLARTWFTIGSQPRRDGKDQD
jgi:4-amino-4-deoxy-L-arabinose transferase-like glycosyltransferase